MLIWTEACGYSIHWKKYRCIVLQLLVGGGQDPLRNRRKDCWDNSQMLRKTAGKHCSDNLEMDLCSASVEQWHIYLFILGKCGTLFHVMLVKKWGSSFPNYENICGHHTGSSSFSNSGHLLSYFWLFEAICMKWSLKWGNLRAEVETIQQICRGQPLKCVLVRLSASFETV